MIDTTLTDTPTTETEQRRKRQSAVSYARASVGLEGLEPSEASEQQAARFIAGEIGLSEFLKPAR
ncbi:antitoxin VbhA family protein [Comamonas sp.]|uniref:antitoxin VbhA family protein n=1 Tax=Comamonas sp. TaxID=34028 RepID=UPI0025852920|nr:antitoxin VbhA family protein [Comamonas sp.]